MQWLLKILQQVFFIWCLSYLSCSCSQIKYSFITTLSFKHEKQCEITMTQWRRRWALQSNIRMYGTWDARLLGCDGVTGQVGYVSLSQATAIRSGVRNYFLNEIESHLKRLESSTTLLWELQVSYNLEWLYLPSYQKEKPKRSENLQAENFLFLISSNIWQKALLCCICSHQRLIFHVGIEFS